MTFTNLTKEFDIKIGEDSEGADNELDKSIGRAVKKYVNGEIKKSKDEILARIDAHILVMKPFEEAGEFAQIGIKFIKWFIPVLTFIGGVIYFTTISRK